MLQQKIEALKASFQQSLTEARLAEGAKKAEALAQLKSAFLGKNGGFTELMKSMKDVPAAEKPAAGKLLNTVKQELEAALKAEEEAFAAAKRAEALAKDKIDITLPAKKPALGSLHPLTLVREKILQAFLGLGFEVYDGPEIETEYHSFEALNIPADHPARDMQDTFYMADGIVLRPHTSPAQIRAMQQKGVPIRILCPGRVFRADDDATHSPMFHQIEGLAVEKNLSLADLKGILEVFAKTVFTPDTKVRFRPSFFPFTEPSVEVDVSCSMCGGKGCRLCKGTGWIEILGAGIVNRHVLENCGVDPDQYRGFAFGLGVERITMIKYGIPDMRLLFENDVRFLEQFR